MHHIFSISISIGICMLLITPAFAGKPLLADWKATLQRHGLQNDGTLQEITSALQNFETADTKRKMARQGKIAQYKISEKILRQSNLQVSSLWKILMR